MVKSPFFTELSGYGWSSSLLSSLCIHRVPDCTCQGAGGLSLAIAHVSSLLLSPLPPLGYPGVASLWLAEAFTPSSLLCVRSASEGALDSGTLAVLCTTGPSQELQVTISCHSVLTFSCARRLHVCVEARGGCSATLHGLSLSLELGQQPGSPMIHLSVPPTTLEPV